MKSKADMKTDPIIKIHPSMVYGWNEGTMTSYPISLDAKPDQYLSENWVGIDMKGLIDGLNSADIVNVKTTEAVSIANALFEGLSGKALYALVGALLQQLIDHSDDPVYDTIYKAAKAAAKSQISNI